jgi:beta-phosphoglucomutase-like phosphatase (HAD superfamily)
VHALDHALEHTLQNVLEVDSSVFAVTVAGDEVDHSKPHPDPYLKAAALLGVPIDKCVVIEDSPTGIASAISSGAFVVAVPSLCDPPTIVWGMSVSSLEQVSIALIQERRHEGKVETDEWRLPTRPVHTHIDNTH